MKILRFNIQNVEATDPPPPLSLPLGQKAMKYIFSKLLN